MLVYGSFLMCPVTTTSMHVTVVALWHRAVHESWLNVLIALMYRLADHVAAGVTAFDRGNVTRFHYPWGKHGVYSMPQRP